MSWLILADESTTGDRIVMAVMLVAACALAGLCGKKIGSSVARKYAMAVTGLLWCGFLVAHLAGNCLMLVGEDVYNGYAHALHSQEWFVKIAEFGLLFLLVLHIVLAFNLTWDNNTARGGVGYGEAESKRDDRLVRGGLQPDYWMVVSGLVVLLFLMLHLTDFAIQARPDVDYAGKEPYDKAKAILATAPTVIVYIVGVIALGYHLGHGFQSAFQSLGLNSPRCECAIKCASIAFAWSIALGFLMFPLLGAGGWLP